MVEHRFEKLDGSKFTFGKGWKDGDFDFKGLSKDPLDKENRYNYLKVLGLLYATAPATPEFVERGKSLRVTVYDERQVEYLEKYLKRNDNADKSGSDKISYDTDFWIVANGGYAPIRNPNFKPYYRKLLPKLSPSERTTFLKSFIPHFLIKSFKEHSKRGRHEKMYHLTTNSVEAENLKLLLHLEKIPFFPHYRTEWRNYGRAGKLRRNVVSFWFIDPEVLEDYLNEDFSFLKGGLERYKPFDDAEDIFNYIISLDRAATIETATNENRAAPTKALEAKREFDDIRTRITRIRSKHRELVERQTALIGRKDTLDYHTQKGDVEKGLHQANGMNSDIETLEKELEVLEEARDDLYEVLFSRKKPRRRKVGFNYKKQVYMDLERHVQ
jgi:hypothetical protein